MEKKKVIFITGTRADFGKLKSLIKIIDRSDRFECYVFVTGMHTIAKYGSTFREVEKQGYHNVFVYNNQDDTTEADIILANTIVGFTNFVKEVQPDMIVVHGDRVEALAGVIVGALNNVLAAHIEGGELSGTVDELIRHAVTKMAHIHFVSNEEAKRRLVQMGENEKSVFIIGSPDIDIMRSENLPTLPEAQQWYEIPYDDYAVFIYHPVTTEVDHLAADVDAVVTALIESGRNYVVIYPNNDKGSDTIIDAYQRLKGRENFRVLPSLRFEYFLTVLKNARFIIGNSSAGVREAEVFGVPAVNIGTRQNNRSQSTNIVNVDVDAEQILQAIQKAETMKFEPTSNFGSGDSHKKFFEIISNSVIWETPIQKEFFDLEY